MPGIVLARPQPQAVHPQTTPSFALNHSRLVAQQALKQSAVERDTLANWGAKMGSLLAIILFLSLLGASSAVDVVYVEKHDITSTDPCFQSVAFSQDREACTSGDINYCTTGIERTHTVPYVFDCHYCQLFICRYT
eukprot:NODE_793_length_1192_cov_145.037559_g752_i0.p1 GENE.NODE_793_length_1192_cov_145.037559_g752_i0~~NODE_793_length_1192_cov_145.037559_g752_i0.p1  ORF type:complete len:136 (+),score=8.22 NODE_793_length_1192_cov_145.037559_g752_i0:225-632(+)